MDANKLLDKILEQELSLASTVELCEKICGPGVLTIGDALWLKDLLGLTNQEAVEIFLT